MYTNVCYEQLGFDFIGGRYLIRLYCLYQLLVWLCTSQFSRHKSYTCCWFKWSKFSTGWR